MAATETVTLTRDPTRPTAGGDGESPADVVIPKRLGSVELRRELGKGGMGVVWLGHHEMLQRDVAVKFLLHAAGGADDPGFTTFLEGARAAAALRHKGLNSVVHADVVEGVPFIVMDYVDGPTLSQVLGRGGPLPPGAARLVLEDSSEAVAELHEHDIVHRDIKPSNIILAGDGAPVLTDFGLACSRPVLGLSSKVEGVAGTPAYMAPEMFDRLISPRSDVYALGVMAYEMLIGRVPFDGSLDAVRRAHRETPFPSEDLAPFHPALADVIARATNKNPMFRLKTGRHLLLALREAFGQMDQSRASRARGEQELAERLRRTQGHAPGAGATPAPAGATYYDRLGTLVQKRRSDEGAGAPEAMVERVEHDLACVRCGTAIRGTPLTGRCPGCLLLVKMTLEAWAGGGSSVSSASGSGSAAGGSGEGSRAAPSTGAPSPATQGEPQTPGGTGGPSARKVVEGVPPQPAPTPAPEAGLWADLKRFWREFTGR